MKTKDSATLKWIFRVSGGASWWMILLLVIRVLNSLACIQYAYALGKVVDNATSGVSSAFYSQLAVFIVLVVLTLVFQASGRYVTEKCKVAMEKNFRMHAFSELLRRDYAQVTKMHTGEWMNRITSDTNVVAQAVTTILPELTGALVRMLGAMVSLLQIAPQVVYILFPCGLVMIFFSYFVRKWLKRYHKAVQHADGKVRSFMQERLYGLLVVRTFTREAVSERMASERMDDYISARMRRFRFTNLSHNILSIAVNGAQVLGIGLCGWGILNGYMSYGTMSSVLYLINLMEAPLATASGYLAQYYSMLASAERLMEIEEYDLDTTEPAVPAETIRKYYAEELDSLGLENACFAYDDADESVLQNFNLEIRKGEFVAFSGDSGCGKSTSLKILLNLYPLKNGQVYLQNVDGTRQKLDSAWRGLFAYVPQGNQLISGTIRETVTFSDPVLMAQDDKIYEALKIACADNFVSALPNGLDTVLGERGSGLSEGQMQRLSVARAILSGRPILLLDESTSALDAVTEEQLLQNLRAMTDRTVLIITHREAALNFCDTRIHFEKS